MTSILDKVKLYYEANGISARNFQCPEYRKCKGECAVFTKAREPFVGTKYDKAGKRKEPRILFVSLDSGHGDRFAKYRTADWAQHWAEHKWKYEGKDKNKHWFQTHSLA